MTVRRNLKNLVANYDFRSNESESYHHAAVVNDDLFIHYVRILFRNFSTTLQKLKHDQQNHYSNFILNVFHDNLCTQNKSRADATSKGKKATESYFTINAISS